MNKYRYDLFSLQDKENKQLPKKLVQKIKDWKKSLPNKHDICVLDDKEMIDFADMVLQFIEDESEI